MQQVLPPERGLRRAGGEKLGFSNTVQYRRDHGYGRTHEALAVDMRARLREHGGAGGADGDDSGAAPPARRALAVGAHHRRPLGPPPPPAAAAAAGPGNARAVQLGAAAGGGRDAAGGSAAGLRAPPAAACAQRSAAPLQRLPRRSPQLAAARGGTRRGLLPAPHVQHHAERRSVLLFVHPTIFTPGT